MRLLYLTVALTTGCGLTGPDEERVLGIIDIKHVETDLEQPAVEVPDTVAVVTPFTVSAITVVGGCTRGGDTEVVGSRNTATITVYDIRTITDRPCTGEGRLFEHLAQVTFDAKGAATVVIRGSLQYEFEVWVE